MLNKDEYLNHGLWTTLDALSEKLQDDTTLDSKTRAFIAYLIENLASRKSSTHYYYLGLSQLNKMRDQLQNILNALSNYPGNPSYYMQQLISYTQDAYSSIATNWPPNNGRTIMDVADSAANRVIEKTQEQLDQLNTTAREIVSSRDRIDALKNDYETSIESWKKSHDTEINEYSASFATKKDVITEEKKAELAKVIETARESADQMKTDWETKISAATADTTGTMEKFLREANTILGNLKNTSNETASKIIADDYRKYARNKAIQAVIYDILAIVFSLAGIYLVWWFLDTHQADQASVSVYKLAIAVATFTISGFLFRRGTAQHKESTAAKRTQLTLAQYRPFIANLPLETREQITNDIADRVFIKGEIDCGSSLAEVMQRKGFTEKDLEALSKFIQQADKIQASGQGVVQ